MRDIGANIRRARVRRKLTQDDLAQIFSLISTP